MSHIDKVAPEFRYKLDIWEGYKFPSYEDGRDLVFKFSGFTSDPGDIEIVLDELTGPIPITSTETFLAQAGQSIFYDPIPYEMLYTNEDKP